MRGNFCIGCRVTAFCMNGGSSEPFREENRNGRVRGRGRALYRQAFTGF